MAIRKMMCKGMERAGISKVEIERTVTVSCGHPHRLSGHRYRPPRRRGDFRIRGDLESSPASRCSSTSSRSRTPRSTRSWSPRAWPSNSRPWLSAARCARPCSRLMRAGVKGIRVQCSGRLGGAEMSRSEFYREGRVPLHTLRADIDYGCYEARTTFGRIGVKVWIYKGDVVAASGRNAARRRYERPPGAAGPPPPPVRRRRSDAWGPPAGGRAPTPAEAARASRPRPPARSRRWRAEASALASGRAEIVQPRREPDNADPPQGQAPQAAPPRPARSKGGTRVAFGEYGIQALERRIYVTNRQIESARIAMTRHIRRGGKVWIIIFPDRPLTEAGRDPDGLRQGLARAVGRQRQARPRPLRATCRKEQAAARLAPRVHGLPLKPSSSRAGGGRAELQIQHSPRPRTMDGFLDNSALVEELQGQRRAQTNPCFPARQRVSLQPSRVARARKKRHRPHLHRSPGKSASQYCSRPAAPRSCSPGAKKSRSCRR